MIECMSCEHLYDCDSEDAEAIEQIGLCVDCEIDSKIINLFEEQVDEQEGDPEVEAFLRDQVLGYCRELASDIGLIERVDDEGFISFQTQYKPL